MLLIIKKLVKTSFFYYNQNKGELMKKGFTLIELLAVIVIIAIIGSIGIYSITKIINKSRANSLTDTAFGVRKAASLYASQNAMANNEEIILDMTPADSNGSNAGEHANLISLTKDPWGKDYKSVIAEITKTNNKLNYTIYFNTSQGCYTLNNNSREMSKGDCFSNVTNVFTGISNIYGLDTANSRKLVRDSNGDLHMLIQQSQVANHLVSKDNGKTWQSTPAFTLKDTRNQIIALKIAGNNQLHGFAYDSNKYEATSKPEAVHFFKNNNSNWQLGKRLEFTAEDNINNAGFPGINPVLLNDNSLEIIYANPAGNSIRNRTWNNNVWSDFSDQITPAGTFIHGMVIPSSKNLYYVHFDMSNWALSLRVRTNNTWQNAVRIVSETIFNNYSAIIDSNDILWVFYRYYQNIKFWKFDTSTNLTAGSGTLDTVTTGITGISATLDGNGNIYVAYSITNASGQPSELAYKVFNKTTNTWSTRKQITTEAVDGLCSKPSFKYQRYFNNMPNIVELLYEQKDVGGSTTNLYYTTIKTLK